jgi:hypothetical protein
MADNIQAFKGFLYDLDFFSFEGLEINIENIESILERMQSHFDDKIPEVPHHMALSLISKFIKEDQMKYGKSIREDDLAWRREIAHQEGMMRGIEAYNEAMGLRIEYSCEECCDKGCFYCN